MMIHFIEIIRNCTFVEMEVPTGVIRLSQVLGGLNMQDLWLIATACTGIVMMVIVFSAYKIKSFCTISNGIWTTLCIVAMAYMPYHKSSTGASYHLWQTEIAVVNVWWLFIIVKALLWKWIKSDKKKSKWNVSGILWALLTLCMVLSVNESKVWPVWYFAMFGVFYLTEYTKEDKENLFKGLVDGSILSFCIVQVAAFFLRPFDELRYMGLHYNSNMAGLYYLIIYVMCLFKLHRLHMECQDKKKTGGKIFYTLLAGVTLSLQFMTICRTAWIVSVVVTVLYGIFVLRKIWQETYKKIIVRGVILVCSMAITFLPVFMAARWAPTVLPIRVWYSDEWGVSWNVTIQDEPTSEKYTDLDEFFEEALGRIVKVLSVAKQSNPFVLKAYAGSAETAYEHVDLIELTWLKDQALRERITTYKAYLEDMTLLGNSNTEGYYHLGEGLYHSWHAQNLWLQIAYYYGAIAGAILILLSICITVYGYRIMKKYKDNPHAIIPFFICIVFFGFGLMDVVWNPGQLVLFLVFFTQLRITEKREESGQEN